MPLIKLIPQFLFTIIATPFIALYAWLCMPTQIIDTLSKSMHKKDHSAYYLYYSGLALATYGLITILTEIINS